MRKIGVAALLILLAGAGPQRWKKAPDFSHKDLKGEVHSLALHKGKVVLLDFWATWCGPCKNELPDLESLQQVYGRDKGFTVLGVTIDEERKEVLKFARKHELSYPIIAAAGDLPGYPIEGFPTAYLIDCKGRIVKEYLGQKDPDELEEDINKELKRCGGGTMGHTALLWD